jgi:hypothetical protein
MFVRFVGRSLIVVGLLVALALFLLASSLPSAALQPPLLAPIPAASAAIPRTLPAGTDVWTSIGLERGTTYAVTIDPQTPTVHEAGTRVGTVFVSQQSVLTYTISGRVTDAGNNGLTGVTISASYISSTTTDASGYYTFTNVASGMYTLTPTLNGYAFSPTTRTVSVPPDAIGQDFIITVDCNSISEIPQVECQALVSLYNSTNGANWTNRTGWLTSSTPCSWYGVTCDTGHVWVLILPQNQLSGTIPAELGNLTHLMGLVLEGNQLSGNIPPELGNLSETQWIRLDYNLLSGTIPPELGNLASTTTRL